MKLNQTGSQSEKQIDDQVKDNVHGYVNEHKLRGASPAMRGLSETIINLSEVRCEMPC